MWIILWHKTYRNIHRGGIKIKIKINNYSSCYIFYCIIKSKNIEKEIMLQLCLKETLYQTWKSSRQLKLRWFTTKRLIRFTRFVVYLSFTWFEGLRRADKQVDVLSTTGALLQSSSTSINALIEGVYLRC
jgi:hypothetical protein